MDRLKKAGHRCQLQSLYFSASEFCSVLVGHLSHNRCFFFFFPSKGLYVAEPVKRLGSDPFT